MKAVLWNSRHRLLAYVLIYTLVFAAMGGALQLYVSSRGRTLIEVYDGFEIRYPAAVYSREALSSLLSGSGIRHWDWTIGYGANPLMDLTGLAELNDPFYLVTLLFKEVTPGVYVLLTYLRLYAAGLAFLYYCRVRRFRFIPSLTACVVYIFCMFTLSFVVKHPVFALALIALPLVWAGIEHALSGKRAFLLTWGVFFSASTCLYYFYIIVLLSLLYTLARYIQLGRRPGWFQNLGRAVLRILLYSIVGVLMSAALLIPQMLGIFSSSRSLVNSYSVPESIPFGLKYIRNELTGLLFSAMGMLRFVPVAIIALLTGLISRKNFRHHKDDIILVAAVIIISTSSTLLSALNGFSKPSYRWWVYGIFVLPVAYANLMSRRDFFTLPETGLFAAGVVGCYYLSIQFGNPAFPRRTTLLLAGMLVALIFVFNMLQRRFGKEGGKWMARLPGIMRGAAAVAVAASVVSYAVMIYSPSGQNYIEDMVPLETASTAYRRDNPANSIYLELGDDSFYRVDTQYAPSVESTYDYVRDNSSLALGYRGVRTSKSITDGGLYMFYQDNHIRNMINGCEIGSLDERSALLSMVGVKYYASDEVNGIPIPYGFEMFKHNGQGNAMWKNKYDLGIGYAVDGYMLEQDAEALHPVERQFAQLQSVVLEKKPGIAAEKLVPEYPVEIMNYTMENVQGLELGAATAKSDSDWASAELVFQPVEGKELYLYMPNMEYLPDDSGQMYPQVEVTTPYMQKASTYRPYYQQYYTPIQADMIHVGYQYHPLDRLRLSFSVPGELSYESLQLVSADMDGYDEIMQRLQERRLQDVVVDDESVSGSIELEKEGLLFLSVPYGEGWTASVNGERVEVLKANSGFCALELPAGRSDIHMEYKTPYFGLSLLLSGLGFAGLIALYVLKRGKGIDFKRRGL